MLFILLINFTYLKTFSFITITFSKGLSAFDKKDNLSSLYLALGNKVEKNLKISLTPNEATDFVDASNKKQKQNAIVQCFLYRK